MNHSDPERLRRILWPDGRGGSSGEIFALLDGARDPRIYPLIERQQINCCCLFAGDLPRVLAEAAPYLVGLSPHSRLTEALLTIGWGRSWGVFLESFAILQDLRRHFRRFLQVRDRRGRRLLFRYYDPRVLRTYLPTCNEEELQVMFGPVDRFVMEDESSGAPVIWRHPERGLQRTAWRSTQPSHRGELDSLVPAAPEAGLCGAVRC
jgi:hypothetical protein